MTLADVSVKRPVFAFMMSAALITLGLFSYRQLGLDLMPKTDYPVVVVMTSLPGASAEEIETQVTKPIEEVVNSINGIDELRASSDQGSSRVIITFVLERDIETAVQDVRDKVATVVARFPRDTRPPVIQKIDPDAAPVLTLVVSGDRSPQEITQIADRKVKQALETVQDVGEVMFNGARQREIQMLLSADRLNAYGLTVDQVRTAVSRQNVELPGGNFTTGAAEIALRTMGRISQVDDFNRIILSYREGAVVRFSDVGRVVDTVEEPRGIARLDGRTAITLQIRKQSGTNTVEVVDRVLAKIPQIMTTLPPDMKIQPIRDQSRFIRRSFEDIQHHLVLGGILASIVVFLFIRNKRVTLISALAIPTSIVGTFTVMKAFGFTLNNMTMLVPVPGDRHRHRRRHRRAGEHRPVHRGEGRRSARGGHEGHRGDRPRRDGDDAVAGGHLPARGVHDRAGGPVLLQLRHHLGGRDPDLDVRVLHADAGALRHLAEAE